MRLVRSGVEKENIETQYIFEFQNWIQLAAWFRLVSYAATFTVFQLLQISQSDFLSVSFWQPVNLIMLISFIAQASFAVCLDRNIFERAGFLFLTALDCALISSLLLLWGAPHAIFLFFLMVVVLIVGLALGFATSLKMAIWASVVYHFVIVIGPAFQPDTMKTAWLINNAALAGVALLSGLLGDQLKTVALDIEGKRDEIQALTDVNELLVENIPSGLFLLDVSGKVLRANRGAMKIFEDLSLEGKELSEISEPLFISLQIAQADLAKQNLLRTEVVHLNYKKEKMILEVIFSNVRKSVRAAGEVVCLVQNLTEIKQLENRVRQKEKLAAVGQLAAGIAHEIRNPLASISGSVQLLQAGLQTQTAEDKKLFSIVIKEIDRLNNLITEFLDFVRPDVRLEDPISLNQLMREVLDMVKVNRQLSQKVEQMTELRAQNVILGHYDKLKQAILNIVINAYQAMTDTLRPEIFVQTYDQDGKVYLVVRDNGIGMSSDNLKRIFEPFHTTKPSGTGLGLAITHKILETHNAEVFVESTLGQGSRFTLVFPSGKDSHSGHMKMNKKAGIA